MDATVAQLILQDFRIGYVITDRQLRVTEVSSPAGAPLPNGGPPPGSSLLDWVPELVGSEALLADILDGKLPSLRLPWVNRALDNGQTAYLNMVDLPYRDQAGQIQGLVHVVEDYTEMGILQQEINQRRNELRLLRDQLAHSNLELTVANEELRRLDEIKSRFVSVASHELRSPLTCILGFLEVLLDGEVGPFTADQRKYLELVQQSARRLLVIANDLLDATRIEAGRIDLVLGPVNLVALVETVIAALKSQVTARDQKLTLHLPPELPPALCDETRAAQIVANLVSNASKYTPKGGEISVSLFPATEEGFLQLSVIDNGVGIAPEDQPRLFDRFFRAGSALAAHASGAGLGLYIARTLIELHGGRIWLESALDEGSAFHVTLPIAE